MGPARGAPPPPLCGCAPARCDCAAHIRKVRTRTAPAGDSPGPRVPLAAPTVSGLECQQDCRARPRCTSARRIAGKSAGACSSCIATERCAAMDKPRRSPGSRAPAACSPAPRCRRADSAAGTGDLICSTGVRPSRWADRRARARGTRPLCGRARPRSGFQLRPPIADIVRPGAGPCGRSGWLRSRRQARRSAGGWWRDCLHRPAESAW